VDRLELTCAAAQFGDLTDRAWQSGSAQARGPAASFFFLFQQGRLILFFFFDFLVFCSFYLNWQQKPPVDSRRGVRPNAVRPRFIDRLGMVADRSMISLAGVGGIVEAVKRLIGQYWPIVGDVKNIGWIA